MKNPAFMAITSTGGYIGRIYWENSGIHPDFPEWGSIHAMPASTIFGTSWAGDIWVIRQVVNWRFWEPE